MADFHIIKANFLYLDFNAFIEREVYTNLENREEHLKILKELEEKIAPFLKSFELSDFHEMPFIDNEGRDNGYFIRKMAENKESHLKGKLELMVKRLD